MGKWPYLGGRQRDHGHAASYALLVFHTTLVRLAGIGLPVMAGTPFRCAVVFQAARLARLTTVLLKCEDLSNFFDIAAPSLPPLSRLTSNFKFLHRCVRVSKVVHMDHKEWLKVATDGASFREVGRKIGVSDSVISQQLRRGRLLSETVIAICRAYDQSPIQGLVSTGYLTLDEVDLERSTGETKWLTGRELVQELAARLDLDTARFKEATLQESNKNVSEIHAHRKKNSYDEGIPVFDYAPHEYAADSSPEETWPDELRTTGGRS
jgi:hypothetical protein